VAAAVACGAGLSQRDGAVAATAADDRPAPEATEGGPLEPPGGLRALFGDEGNDLRSLRVEDVVVGVGPSVQIGDQARVHYVGRLTSGHEFDSSRTRGRPLEFGLGRGMVIRGFERGMVGMRVGGVRRITIPPELGYGAKGSPPMVPPNATLVFEIELLDIPLPASGDPKKPGGGPGGGFQVGQ
jgi:hypothetical protein